MLTSISMEDDWHVWILCPDCLSDSICIRQAELSKLLWTEVMRPAVKELHHLSTRLDLIAHICDEGRGQVIKESVKEGRVIEHDGLKGNKQQKRQQEHMSSHNAL